MPRLCAKRISGPSSMSVVMWVIKARFFTRPHPSPSGVSEGHSIPHCDGCNERGPETLRVFSNWLVIIVIMPTPATYESRERTWVTPCRSILKRLMIQLPVEMAMTRPLVMMSGRICFVTSNCCARCRGMVLLAIFCNWRGTECNTRQYSLPSAYFRVEAFEQILE